MSDRIKQHSPLSVNEARQRILQAVRPIEGNECITVSAALNRVLAQNIVASHNVPAYNNAAMDGYAVRASDLNADAETTLTVIGTAFAGNPFPGLIGPRQAVRIMTGAVIPEGVDTIIVQEIIRPGQAGNTIVVPAGQQAGQNIRQAGEDLAQNSVALTAGTVIGPVELGIIASLGQAEVIVQRRLRVALFSTGDELAPIGTPLLTSQIYDSNRYTLSGALSHLHCDMLDMGIIPDNPKTLEAALREASQNVDAIITSGGVSVGEADFIRDITTRLGHIDFWKINIKPGRPMAFGYIGNACLFGLPGNPVAVLVAFYQFVQNALLKMMGITPLPDAQYFSARITDAIRKPAGRCEFIRGYFSFSEGVLSVHIAGAQGSGMLSSMLKANCFIILPESVTDIHPGDLVTIEPFRGLI